MQHLPGSVATDKVLRGALAGLIATVPMSAVMLLVQKLLPPRQRETVEPRQISDEMLHRAKIEHRTTEAQQQTFAATAHFAYGAGAGSAYPLVRRLIPSPVPPGLAYGLALYAASYAGWLPAFNVLPPPHRRGWGRNVLLVSAHVVWGMALEHSTRRLSGASQRVDRPGPSHA